MDVRFKQYQLIEEEFWEEKSIVLQGNIFIQDENEPILVFDGVRESLTMDASSLKAPIQMDSTLVPSFEETMKVQVQEEKGSTKVQEETKEENEILVDMEEKEFESKLNLEVVLPIIVQFYSYPLHFPNLRIEVIITMEALLSFSMSKLRNDAIYDVFPMYTWYLFFGKPLKFGPKIVSHETPNFSVRTLTLNLLNSPQP